MSLEQSFICGAGNYDAWINNGHVNTRNMFIGTIGMPLERSFMSDAGKCDAWMHRGHVEADTSSGTHQQ